MIECTVTIIPILAVHIIAVMRFILLENWLSVVLTVLVILAGHCGYAPNYKEADHCCLLLYLDRGCLGFE